MAYFLTKIGGEVTDVVGMQRNKFCSDSFRFDISIVHCRRGSLFSDKV